MKSPARVCRVSVGLSFPAIAVAENNAATETSIAVDRSGQVKVPAIALDKMFMLCPQKFETFFIRNLVFNLKLFLEIETVR
ncbi:exported hypothetical protein [Vibrio crassostreae]|nr:exported hypothetical protein [Vibrio crassostreae]CAK1713919.1 exported hypothetical protein [Vibrio crassostreae]CAK1714263.1 exported hypothetical protein [Vibrio crassostreae]CAK1734459.1 exported hypothetical protein [Vibrio crassostreae]CAK1760202.1 exported hypothetical protein [Vibrio crassostreae]